MVFRARFRARFRRTFGARCRQAECCKFILYILYWLCALLDYMFNNVSDI